MPQSWTHKCIECGTTQLNKYDQYCKDCYWKATAGRDPKVEYTALHADEMPNGYGGVL